MKSNYGVSRRKNTPSNEIDLTDLKTLESAKAKTIEAIEAYRRQCSRWNYYGHNRANELQKRIEYAKNMDFLRDEITYFLKTGKTEADRANYNIFRSLSRRSGTGDNDLRGILFNKLAPSYSYYKHYNKTLGQHKLLEFMKLPADQMRAKLVFDTKPEIAVHAKNDDTLLSAKKEALLVINSYKKQCSLLNFYGKNRAEELQSRVENADNMETLRNEVTFFLKTGKTEIDDAARNVFRSPSRSSGFSSDSLRGKLYDKFIPAHSFYNKNYWLRCAKANEFAASDIEQMKQRVIFSAGK